MMVAKVIMFLVTTTIAKHHHSDLGTNDDFFDSVYVAIHSVVNDLFESIDLGMNFTNQSNTKSLLTMHHDLRNIADVAIETYNVIQSIINDTDRNQTYFIYSHNETEEDVIKLDTMVNEILNKNNFDVYRTIKGTKHNQGKNKIQDYDGTEDKDESKVKDKSAKRNINPAFENSEEFKEFVINFLTKVNNLTIHDFKKSVEYGRLAVPSKKNLKAWDAPSSLIYDLEESNTRRIFGGSKTRVNSFPFIVSIHIMGEFTCSGCIISRDLVITAASCLGIAYNNDFFERNLKSIYVRLGSDHTTRGGETIPVQNLYFHPEFEPKHLKNNLAIIKLEKRVRFSRKQKKIRRILWDKTSGILPNATREILILGWGATKKDQVTQKHPKLRVSILDVYNSTDCKKKYTEDFIAKENFCAALNGTNGSACNGDVGGPGIVGEVLMGVISFGAPECGVAGAPTVFTKLGYYVPWIESIMDVPNKRNKKNNESIETRRKSKHSKKKRFQVNNSSNDKLHGHGHHKDYPEEEIALRDTLIELVNDNQSVVHDVIYGEMYDEFNKFLNTKEEKDSKNNFIYTEKQRTSSPNHTPAPLFELKINIQTDSEPRTTAHPPMQSISFKPLSLRKHPGDSDYETDNDAVQNDYSDNYEKSSKEEHGLGIKALTSPKLGLRNKGDAHETTWMSNSESEQRSIISEVSSDYSAEIREFFATNRERSKNKNFYKRRDTADGTRSILRNGSGKERSNEVVMKHEQLFKHAGSVLDEGKSLATKTFSIDLSADVQVNYDKVKRKNYTSKTDSRKSKDILRSDKTITKSFFLQF